MSSEAKRAAGPGKGPSTEPLRVGFRCDASLAIGTGHVARCLALADRLRADGAETFFICRDLPGGSAARIAEQGHGVTLLPPPTGPFLAPEAPPHAAWAGVLPEVDAAETRAAIAAHWPGFGRGDDVLVLDHYAFDARWQEVALAPGARLVVIDDLADRPHRADLLLDQNLGRVAEDYAPLVPPDCSLLIGPQYALLRPEFAAMRGQSLASRAARGFRLETVLITMGGVDLPNASGKALEALVRFFDRHGGTLSVTLVMGRNAPGLEAVRAAAAMAPFDCRVLVDVSDMARLMAEADLAIGAAGSTAWERCALGLPSLMAVLAENQREVAAGLDRSGAAIALSDAQAPAFADNLDAGLEAAADPVRLAAMSAAAAALTDGGGLALVAERIAQRPKNALRLSLRRATMQDAEPVWHWRAEMPRSHLRSGAETPLSDHLDWFSRAIVAPSRRLYMVDDASGAAVAHLRLDLNEDHGAVSILLAPQARGRGLGVALLRLLVPEARAMGLSALDAEIHPENTASHKVFLRAGYLDMGRSEGFLQLRFPLNAQQTDTE